MSVISHIHNRIQQTLNRIGSDVTIKVRGADKTVKSTMVDPSNTRGFNNLPDWKSQLEFTLYISYKTFLDNGFLHADIVDIESAYYHGIWYKVLKASPYGFLQNQAAWIMLRLSK